MLQNRTKSSTLYHFDLDKDLGVIHPFPTGDIKMNKLSFFGTLFTVTVLILGTTPNALARKKITTQEKAQVFFVETNPVFVGEQKAQPPVLSPSLRRFFIEIN